MKKLEEIKKTIANHKREVENIFKVKQIGIFGSFVRNEQESDSDLDILVEFREPIGLFQFIDLEEYLERVLGIKVDLVSKKALKPYIGAQILKEVEYL